MFVIGMRAPEIATSVRAGQFVNLGWEQGPLLRRPFSVYRADGDQVEVVLKAVGVGTSQLLGMRIGDRISCLGPLGRGFEMTGSRALLISGGLGVAPMLLAARDARAAGAQVTWVHGARTAADLCAEADGDDVLWATEDGSRGFRGTAVAAAYRSSTVGIVPSCARAASRRRPAAIARGPAANARFSS